MMRFTPRPALESRVAAALRSSPVTIILGPRQCGKTTLARRIARRRLAAYFDLEDPQGGLPQEAAAHELRRLRGLVVIDECQRQPGLFPLLRVLADRRPLPARFLLLGSAAPDLALGASESLAGRLAHIEMEGFSVAELGAARVERLWLRGGLPPSYQARSDSESLRWRLDYAQSLLERDLPQLGIRIPAPALRRFWTMLAHLHGSIWNASELARAMGVQEATARRYLDVLTGAFVARQLPPWFTNIGKRLVKAPKIYIRDSGLLHALLGIRTRSQLCAHPKLGFSWEGFALEEVIRAARAERDAFFYRTMPARNSIFSSCVGARPTALSLSSPTTPDSPAPCMWPCPIWASPDYGWSILGSRRCI